MKKNLTCNNFLTGGCNILENEITPSKNILYWNITININNILKIVCSFSFIMYLYVI